MTEADGIELWKRAAQKGDLTSQLLLGQCFENGRGVGRVDYAEAFKYFKRAADSNEDKLLLQDDSDMRNDHQFLALMNTAAMLWRGDGVARDRDMAEQYWILASEKDSEKTNEQRKSIIADCP
jgi:TPR repeat protein